MPPAQPCARPVNSDRIPLGIGLGVLAYSLFAMHDAANKWLVSQFSVWQVIAFRSAMIVLACLLIGRTKLLARAVETKLKPALAARLGKEAVNQALETSLAEGLAFERKSFQLLFASEDQKEGMRAFLEKRPGEFQGR